MAAMERIRCFVAVEIDPAVRSRLALDALRSTDADVRWVRPENVHLTLRFLGELLPEQADRVSEGLAGVRGSGPFELAVSGLGHFGSRVVWAGCAGDLGALRSLWEKVQAAARAAGLPRDEHGFSPHVTLGRVRSRRGFDGLRRELESRASEEFGRQRVDRFVLMQSRLEPAGSVYAPVRTYPL